MDAYTRGCGLHDSPGVSLEIRPRVILHAIYCGSELHQMMLKLRQMSMK
jgi:hypothetical protein